MLSSFISPLTAGKIISEGSQIYKEKMENEARSHPLRRDGLTLYRPD